MRPPPLLRRSFYGAEGHRLSMEIDPRLSSILSAIDGEPRAVNAFMDFLHSLQVQKDISLHATHRFEAFAKHMEDEVRGLRNIVTVLVEELRGHGMLLTRLARSQRPFEMLTAPARQLPRPRKTKPKKTKRRKHR
jgi:hypothetical protein